MSASHNSAVAHSHPLIINNHGSALSGESFHRENTPFPDSGTGIKMLLEFAAKECETKTELQVFLCLIRFSVLVNRARCLASKSYIAKWTGLDPSNVKRGIEGLIARKLILKTKSDACSEYEILFPKGGQVDLGRVNLTPVTLTQPRGHNDPSAENKITTQVPEIAKLRGQLDPRAGVEVTPNRVSDLINKYIQSLKFSSKLYPEKNALEKLLEFAKPDELDLCFLHIEKNGAVGDGKKCLMPLSYLLKSFDRVLELASVKAVEESRVLELKTLADGRIEREREMQRLEEDRYAKAQSAFELAFPEEDAQKAALTPIIQSKFKFSSGNSKLVRRLAVLKWFEMSGKAMA